MAIDWDEVRKVNSPDYVPPSNQQREDPGTGKGSINWDAVRVANGVPVSSSSDSGLSGAFDNRFGEIDKEAKQNINNMANPADYARYQAQHPNESAFMFSGTGTEKDDPFASPEEVKYFNALSPEDQKTYLSNGNGDMNAWGNVENKLEGMYNDQHKDDTISWPDKLSAVSLRTMFGDEKKAQDADRSTGNAAADIAAGFLGNVLGYAGGTTSGGTEAAAANLLSKGAEQFAGNLPKIINNPLTRAIAKGTIESIPVSEQQILTNKNAQTSSGAAETVALNAALGGTGEAGMYGLQNKVLPYAKNNILPWIKDRLPGRPDFSNPVGVKYDSVPSGTNWMQTNSAVPQQGSDIGNMSYNDFINKIAPNKGTGENINKTISYGSAPDITPNATPDALQGFTDRINSKAAEPSPITTGNPVTDKLISAEPPKTAIPKEKNTVMAAAIEHSDTPNGNLKPVYLSEGPEKISQFRTNTIERSTMLPDSVKEQLPIEEFEYEPEKAAEWQQKAQDAIANNKQKVIDDITNAKAISGGQQAHEAAIITSDYLNKARQTGDYSGLSDWLKTVAEKTRETARALKGTDTAWDKTSAEGALVDAERTVQGVEDQVKKVNPARVKQVNKETQDLIDKISTMTDEEKANYLKRMFAPKAKTVTPAKPLVDKVNEIIRLGAYDDSNIRDLIKAKNNLPILTQNEAAWITDMMDKANTLPEGSREQQILRAKVQQLILDKRPSSVLDKANALRNISLLGNLRTNTRNVSGNTILGALDNTANTLEATVLKPVDLLMKKHTGLESTALPNLGIQAKGFVKGAKDAVSDSFGGLRLKDLKGLTPAEKAKVLKEGFLNPIDTSGMVTKFETGKKLAFKNPILRGMENAVNSALRIGDRPFDQAYYDDAINQMLKSNPQLKGKPTQEMIDTAKQVAEERTFQDDNTISTELNKLKNLPQGLPDNGLKTALQFTANSILPYVRTPASILKRGLEYTPVGLAEGGLKLGANLKHGTLTLAKQREIMDRLGRGLVGTGVGAAGYAAAKNGLATGAASDDKDVAALQKQAGKLPNSVGGYTVDWAQPASMPFLAGVQMAQSGKNGGNKLNAAKDAMVNGLNFYTDQPMVQSLQKLAGSPYDQKGVGQRVLESAMSFPGQFVPTALKQSVQVGNPNTKETYSPDNFTQNAVNPILAKLPWLNQFLPDKVDTLGRPVQNPNAFDVLLDPGTMSQTNGTPVEQELLRLYDATGDKKPFPMVANKTITYTDRRHQQQKIQLTPDQYVQYQQELGQLTNNAYNQIINNPAYQATADDNKAKMLTRVLDKINTFERKRIIQQNGGK